MKYNLFINQKYLYENFENKISLTESCVFDVLYNIISCYNNFKYINENNKIYVWINTSIITKELPLLNVGERQIKNIISKLVELELLEMYYDNQKIRKTYICLGIKALNINSDFNDNKNEKNFIPIDNNDKNTQFEKKNTVENEKNFNLSMKKTSYNNNTIDNVTYYNKEEEANFEKFAPPPERLTSQGVYDLYKKQGKINYRGNLFFKQNEIETLKSKWNADKLDKFLDRLDNWISTPKNWKLGRSHYLTVNSWLNEAYDNALQNTGQYQYQIDLEWKANNNDNTDYTDFDLSKNMLVEDF